MRGYSSQSSWRHFLELCAKINSPEEFGRFFDLFLSMEEKSFLAQRYLTVKSLLEEELSQREIATAHNGSISEIISGSNAVEALDPSLKHALKILLDADQ